MGIDIDFSYCPGHADRKPLLALSHKGIDAALNWHPDYGDRGTLLAVTGDDVDPAEIAALLSECELTEAEMSFAATSFEDRFELNFETQTQQRSNS
jgi:hypothetical protein